MSALYILSGVLTGVASTAIGMGGDGRIGILFVPSLLLAAAAAAMEYNR